MSQNSIGNKIGSPTNTEPLTVEKSASNSEVLAVNDQSISWGIYSADATPEGAITANKGSLALGSTLAGSAIPFTKTTDGVNTGWLAIVTQTTYNAWTPIVYGNVTPGAGTYTTQTGHWIKHQNFYIATATITWTAHTGFGNLRMNLPTIDQMFLIEGSIYTSGITFPAGTSSLFLQTVGSGQADLIGYGSAAVPVGVTLPATGTLVYTMKFMGN
jgi:hypothetical protein